MKNFSMIGFAAILSFVVAYNIFADSPEDQSFGRTSAWAEITGMDD